MRHILCSTFTVARGVIKFMFYSHLSAWFLSLYLCQALKSWSSLFIFPSWHQCSTSHFNSPSTSMLVFSFLPPVYDCHSCLLPLSLTEREVDVTCLVFFFLLLLVSHPLTHTLYSPSLQASLPILFHSQRSAEQDDSSYGAKDMKRSLCSSQLLVLFQPPPCALSFPSSPLHSPPSMKHWAVSQLRLMQMLMDRRSKYPRQTSTCYSVYARHLPASQWCCTHHWTQESQWTYTVQ